MNHQAHWIQEPNAESSEVAQFHCVKCRLTLELSYNRNLTAIACTGRRWRVTDDGGHNRSASASQYLPLAELDSAKEQGVSKFNSYPCIRPN